MMYPKASIILRLQIKHQVLCQPLHRLLMKMIIMIGKTSIIEEFQEKIQKKTLVAVDATIYSIREDTPYKNKKIKEQALL
jgi:hypothetical protein